MSHPTDPIHVAIDGPAGSGKSTVAARLAAELGFTHVDTGAMYRALTLVSLRDGIAPEDGAGLGQRLAQMRLEFDDRTKLHLDGEDVSEAIRTREVTALVSAVSAHAAVRAGMVARQRDICWSVPTGAVMEGRDIGSVVLPLAPVKIYLMASAEERARRRVAQLGLDAASLVEIQRDIEARDERDQTRQESPLIVSPDAHVVDTTHLDVGQVIAKCAELVRQITSAPSTPVPAPYVHARYRFFHAPMQGLYRFLFGLRVRGRHHQAVPGSAIYASNHVSNFDPLIVGASIGREVWFLAKKELFFWPLGWLIRAFNAIPIVRGRFDPVAFERAKQVLREGKSLLVFPEGTRRPEGEPGPVKRGLGILAMESGRPYVPLFVSGTPHLGAAMIRRRRLEVWCGPPVTLHALDHLAEKLSEAEVRARVGQLYLAQLRAFQDRASRAQ